MGFSCGGNPYFLQKTEGFLVPFDPFDAAVHFPGVDPGKGRGSYNENIFVVGFFGIFREVETAGYDRIPVNDHDFMVHFSPPVGGMDGVIAPFVDIGPI